MDGYQVGALADFISGKNTPKQGKVIEKHINNKTNKSPSPQKQVQLKNTPQQKQAPKRTSMNSLKNTPTPKKRKAQVIADTEEMDDHDSAQEDDDSEDIDSNESEAGSDPVNPDNSDDEDEDIDSNESELGSDPVDPEDSDDGQEDSDEKTNAELAAVASDDDSGDEPEEVSSKLMDNNTVKGSAIDPDVQKLKFSHRTIFVGNVDITVTKKTLQQRFKKYGPVETVRIRSIAVENPKMDRKVAIQKRKLHPERKTCNAYVQFAKKEDAINAAEGENGKELAGLHIRVNMAVSSTVGDNRRTLFVGNLSFKAEDEDLWKAFEPCGAIESVRIVRDKNTQVSLGFAYVNFKSADSVQLALEMGDVTVNKRVLRLSVSEFNKKNKTTDIKKCVFIPNIEKNVSVNDIKAAFESCGKIEKIRKQRNRKGDQKGKDYCFITFETEQGAQAAFEQKTTLNGAKLEVMPSRRTAKQKIVKQQTGKFVQKDGAKDPHTKKVNRPKKLASGSGIAHNTNDSPTKSFQGAHSKVGKNKNKKVNRGELQKKQMIKKVAPK